MNTTTNNDIYVEGVKLYPTSVEPGYTMADLQASGVRSWETGVMKLNPIRNDVFSIDLQWLDIPLKDAQHILQTILPQSDGGSSCNVYNPITGKRETKRMYRSDRIFKQRVYKNGVYADVSFSIIEL